MIHTHPDQPEMQAEVILASQGLSQRPIYTVRMRYPRIIHSEIMTHRVFSRNARSSRAVPIARMIEEVRTKPFIPWHWGKNQKGMQADEECNEPLLIYIPSAEDADSHRVAFSRKFMSREDLWKFSSKQAVANAKAFMTAGYHKQVVNRLLEPFMWIDTLVTSTDWENFFWLRDHKDAEPHLQDLARLVEKALNNAPLINLEPGEWHLPYVSSSEEDSITSWMNSRPGSLGHPDSEMILTMMQKISAARCARISYAPFDGDASYERELERYESLVSSDRIHASPLEHQATPDIWDQTDVDFFGDPDGWQNKHLHGNLNGYIQFRKTVSGENHDD